MSPYEACVMYLSVKRHFTDSAYDFVKYNGKIKFSIKSFEKRRDKYQFSKLAKHKDLKGLLISNYVSGQFTGWVGDLLDEKSEDIYNNWISKQQSITYTFRTELESLDDEFISYFRVKNGQYPPLLVLYNRGIISLETIIILDDFLKFFSIWDEKITDTIIWPSIRLRAMKYRPFIHYDKTKIKSILLSVTQKPV